MSNELKKISGIEWLNLPGYIGQTWNITTGCSKISDGCRHCWAEDTAQRMAGLFGYDQRHPFRVTVHEDRWDIPRKKKKPHIFAVSLMGDLFHPDVPIDTYVKIAQVIADTYPRHLFLFLTKRPERMVNVFLNLFIENNKIKFRQQKDEFEPFGFLGKYASVIWCGTTTENQEMADERIPFLCLIPSAVRFVSAEPLLETIDLRLDLFERNKRGMFYYRHSPSCSGMCDRQCIAEGGLATAGRIDWVIAGHESGYGARLVKLDAFRDLRDQCQEYQVPFFLKQYYDPQKRQRVSTPELDGKTWTQFPVPSLTQPPLSLF